MKIGIIREGKIPPDARVALTPAQCVEIQNNYDVTFVIEPSEGRCIPDQAYIDAELELSTDLSDCDVLMGIKEVPKDQLIPNKTYMFFSHTIKEQPYNRSLLQTILKKNITLLDYETITESSGRRVIAFGRFAGIAGAHNGMMTYAHRTGAFDLKQMHQYPDFATAIAYYQTLTLPKMKIVLTGTGRVANGAAEVLDHMNIKKVSPKDFLNKDYEEAVYTQLDCEDYAAHRDDKPFVLEDFFKHPYNYKSIFKPYTRVADLMINGIYWDNQAPQFFTAHEMKDEDFSIKVIADITCDIAPTASIPSTLFASTIADPVFGYNPDTQKDTSPYKPYTIDVMSIDNLPNELPKDASQAFGEQFMGSVLEELLGLKNTGMIERASVTINGELGPHFQYLTDYVNEKQT